MDSTTMMILLLMVIALEAIVIFTNVFLCWYLLQIMDEVRNARHENTHIAERVNWIIWIEKMNALHPQGIVRPDETTAKNFPAMPGRVPPDFSPASQPLPVQR